MNKFAVAFIILISLFLNASIAQSEEKLPLIFASDSDQDIELLIAGQLKKLKGWNSTIKPEKSGDKFYIVTTFNLNKKYKVKAIINSNWFRRNKNTKKILAGKIKIFIFNTDKKNKVINRELALDKINAWVVKKTLPLGVYIDKDNDVVCNYFLFTSNTAPIHAGQVVQALDLLLDNWTKFLDYLKSNGAISG